MDELLLKSFVGQKFETQMKALPEVNTKDFTATFICSTSDVDRHGEIVDQDTWILEHFLKNPVLLDQHKSHEFPLGLWLEMVVVPDPDKEGYKMLKGTAQFAVKEYERAKVAFDLVAGGYMRAISAGFIPNDVKYIEETDTIILLNNELIESSLVSIPSNRRSLLVKKAEVQGIETLDFLDPVEEKITTLREAREQVIKAKEIVQAQIKSNQYDPRSEAVRQLNKALRKML